ncbi:MAG: S1C family serine protease [Christensenellaceae bacterium]
MKKLFKNKFFVLTLCLVLTVSLISGCNLLPGSAGGSSSKSNGFIKNSATPTNSVEFDVADYEKLNAIEQGKSEYDLSQYVDLKKVLKRIKKSVVEVYATASGSTSVSAGSAVVVSCNQKTANSADNSQSSSASNSTSVTENDADYTSILITCHHVIEGASTVKIITEDGSEYDAYLVGSDPDSDICVMSVNANLSPVEFYTDTDLLEVGEDVVVIGNPLGTLGGTVTKGILSATSRNVNVEGVEMSLLQTDAAINSGNSGGGLFTSTGLFIGMVNAKFSSAYQSIEGLGFAIDANRIRDIAEQLVSTSTETTPGYIEGKYYLGYAVANVIANRWGSQSYVAIVSLDQNGCFYKSGLRVNDELQSFTYNGSTYTIGKAEDFVSEFEAIKFKIGDTVTFRIVRNSTNASVELTIQQYIYGV